MTKNNISLKVIKMRGVKTVLATKHEIIFSFQEKDKTKIL